MSGHIHSSRELFMQEMRLAGVDVSRETRDRLETMVHLLIRWQKAINLVGKATLEDIWIRHVLDSAQLAILVPKTARKLTDMGSGAGFPGLVIAAFRPELEVTLIESDARKAAYLGEAGRRMELAIPAQDPGWPDRGRAADQSRDHHSPGSGAARQIARLCRAPPR